MAQKWQEHFKIEREIFITWKPLYEILHTYTTGC